VDGWSAVDGSVETNCGENGGASQQRHKLYLVGLRAWRNIGWQGPLAVARVPLPACRRVHGTRGGSRGWTHWLIWSTGCRRSDIPLMPGGVAPSLAVHEISHGWWRLGENSVFHMEVRVATWVATNVTTTVTRWWRVGSARGLLVSRALAPSSLSWRALLLNWRLIFTISQR